MKSKLAVLILCVTSVCLLVAQPNAFSQGQEAKPDFSMVPGTVIAHSPASTKKYIGSPSITILPNGDYVASHDYFGPGGDRRAYDETIVYSSTDKGKTWKKLTTIKDQWWSTLFVFQGDLYLIGTRGGGGDMIIRKSTDGGATWTDPIDEETGVIAEGDYHCAPVPVIEHNGRIWRAMEEHNNGAFKALMLSAPVQKDLLKSASWTISNGVGIVQHWYDHNMLSWREGNVVVKPDGEIGNLIRVEIAGQHNVAALLNVSSDGKRCTFDPYEGFVTFPDGTGKKFTVRFDPTSKKYWAVSNWIQPKDLDLLKHKDAASIRNTVVLVSSEDLRDWTIERILLHHPDHWNHAFQYPDWVFEGEDLVMVSRTCYDDGLGGAANRHDANFMTFHRIKDFRNSLNH